MRGADPFVILVRRIGLRFGPSVFLYRRNREGASDFLPGTNGLYELEAHPGREPADLAAELADHQADQKPVADDTPVAFMLAHRSS